MKLRNSSKNIAQALLAALVIAGSAQVHADDSEFSLVESIRQEIFQELKSNVEHLYRNARVAEAEANEAAEARVVSNNERVGFVVPINNSARSVAVNRPLDNIN